MSLIDKIKNEMSLREYAEKNGVEWAPEKSNFARGDYWACCPFHQEKTPSFHIVEKAGRNGFFYCFGCHEKGDLIAFASKIKGISSRDAIKALASDGGISADLTSEEKARAREKQARAREKQERIQLEHAQRGRKIAFDIWQNAKCGVGDPLLHQYLSARGVDVSAIGGVPSSLKIDYNLPCRVGGDLVYRGAAMIAPIGRKGFRGIHRTWITPGGRARLDSGEKVPKQWLGATGHMHGQPIKLSRSSDFVVIGEGIETTLAAWSHLKRAGHFKWCAEAGASRGAICDEKSHWMPGEGVKSVLLLGEGSAKNPIKARNLYESAALRLRQAGYSVRLAVPDGDWRLDLDFADIAARE